MKKLIAVIAALVFVFSATALAEGLDTDKIINATYSKEEIVAPTELYAISISWAEVQNAAIEYSGDVYTWDQENLKYVKTPGTLKGNPTTNVSVTVVNRGNKAAKATLSFQSIEGIATSFAGVAGSELSGNVASAAPAFDADHLDATLEAVGEAKDLTLNGVVTVTAVEDESVLKTEAFKLGTAMIAIGDAE